MLGAPHHERGTAPDGSLDRILAAIEEANPDYRLVGSLGRAVLHDAYYGDAYREYDARGERPLRTSAHTARDIDLLGAPVIPDIASPYRLDTVWEHNRTAAIENIDGEWRLYSDRHGFNELLPPEVMEPVRGKTIYTIDAVTVRPQTHLALFAVRGSLDRKDRIPLECLAGLLEDEQTPLPQVYYDVFYDLAAQQRKSVGARMRRALSRLNLSDVLLEKRLHELRAPRR